MELRESSTPIEAQDPATTTTLQSEAHTEPETMKTDPTPDAAEPEAHAGEKTETHRHPDKSELVDQLEELAARDAADIAAEDVSRIKQQFYLLHNDEVRRAREAFIEGGGDAEAFVPGPDPLEEKAKTLFQTVKEKKAVQRAAIEAQLQANYDAKKEIVEKLRAMSADTDNVNRLFPEVREMQTRFKELGDVPQQLAGDLWKNYQEAVEQFYDQLKINKELRDYDFKKNLAEKEALVAEAGKLTAEEDVIVAFKRLQELHEQWRAIGPVPKEVREEIWSRFKAISAEVNKKYQDFFVERKAKERENEEAKTALCEKVEALDFRNLSTYASWDAMTREFIDAQNEWRKLGYASRKANNALFARFRGVCDKFFAAKADFFREMKDVLARNLERKTALCERAEALKDSTDWRATADELTAMQKEWKTIGPVAKKHSDQVWNRFLAACDHFFEQKKKNTSGTRRNERANLEQKQEIIDRLKAIEADTPDRDAAVRAVRDLQAEWQSVGHVPFAEKDKIYDAYRAVVNRIYEKFDISRRGARMESFENSLSEMGGDHNRLLRERERLLRVYEQRRSEILTYENNMGFLSARSKNADSMLRDMQRRMQRLKDDLAELETKIKSIDSKL